MGEIFKKDSVIRVLLGVIVGLVIVFAGALIFAGRKSNNGPISFLGLSNDNSVVQELPKAVVNIGGNHLIASVANNPITQSRGLSNIKSIGPKEGKMFTFEEEGIHSFHMKGMMFDLDFIFVNKDNIVVDIVTNVSKDFVGVIQPKFPSMTVFEVNAGYVEANNISIGQKIMWTLLEE